MKFDPMKKKEIKSKEKLLEGEYISIPAINGNKPKKIDDLDKEEK